VMSMSVCLSVYPLAYLKNHTAALRKVLHVDRDHGLAFSWGIARHYAHPVLWMTSH